MRDRYPHGAVRLVIIDRRRFHRHDAGSQRNAALDSGIKTYFFTGPGTVDLGSPGAGDAGSHAGVDERAVSPVDSVAVT
ncbi:hypothetical protein EP51_41525 (plasmid) [Rhodococcus opacus]|uniref:Uncharacterized protein n=1 Tax=Rhodococcus opacus TaxID=37919 RepID=A0A076EZM2_RHOOP|nr:hypothetical protein EP51_41525 [Rhodococcus opacus]